MTAVAEMFAEQGPAILTQARLEDLVLDLITAGQVTTKGLVTQLVYRAHPTFRASVTPGTKMAAPVAKAYEKASRRWGARVVGVLKKHEALGRIRAIGKGQWEIL